jgi:hypothetical protein
VCSALGRRHLATHDARRPGPHRHFEEFMQVQAKSLRINARKPAIGEAETRARELTAP